MHTATLIAEGESYYVEFKSCWTYAADGSRVPRDLKDVATDVAETMVAFANADGGDLVVGVEDSREVTGVPWDGDRIRFLMSAHRDRIVGGDPGIKAMEVAFAGQRILQFRVESWSGDPLATASGRVLIRQKAASVPMAPGDVRRLKARRRGDIGHEAEIVSGATLDDLDLDLVGGPAQGALERMNEPLTRLRYWSLVEGHNGTTRIRRAALLLFAKEPLRWHPNNRVRLRAVVGPAEGWGATLGTRELEIQGPIVRCVPDTIRRLTGALVMEARRGQTFEATTQIPQEAIDECVVNAIVHRNYAIDGQAVEIVRYPDRVEFRSPGDLPDPLTVRDLLRLRGAHRSRNPLIMRVMRDFGWTRDQGEGMRRIFSSIRQVELTEPEVGVEGDTFLVRLSTRTLHDESTLAWLAAYGAFGLRPEHRKVLLAMRKMGGCVSPQIVGREIGWTFDQTKAAFQTLEQQGILWHKPKAHRHQMVPAVAVPLERALRTIASLPEPMRERDLAQRLRLDVPMVRATLDAWRDAGIVEPTEGGFVRGPALREWAKRREQVGW